MSSADWTEGGTLSTQALTPEERIADLEAAMTAFEKENPELSEAIQTLGLTIDEYEKILSETVIQAIGTTNNTSGLNIE